MAESESGQDKTEDPTDKRKREAREKGEIARSKELNTVVVMLVGAAGLLAFGGSMAEMMMQLMRDNFTISREALMDERFKAVISIAPWGMNTGFWNAEGLSGVRIPIFFIAGSADDVSGYEKGVRSLFKNTINVDRYLLTFNHANHNAAAPIPAPAEAWKPSPHLDFVPFEHYADAVWDNVRMNNITQHFATAYFGQHLKQNVKMKTYLDLVEESDKGVFAAEKDGTLKPEHTYWKGFQNRTAKGLRLEFLPKK